MKTAERRISALAAFLLVVLFSAPAWAAQKAAKKPVSQIVVFGTSLSDPGNAFVLLDHQANTPPYDDLAPVDHLLVPSMPYDKGGHHFSNGPTWIEQMAASLALAENARPAFQSPGTKATNYAIGGTRAGDTSPGSPRFSDQVGVFLTTHNFQAPSDALYVIEIGGNDVRDALLAYLGGGDAASLAVINAAVTAIHDNIAALWLAGARHFLVWNAPDIGLTPALAIMNFVFPGVPDHGTQASAAFNASLGGMLSALPQELPGIEIAVLDIFSLLQNIAEHPEAYDLANVTSACIMPEVPPYQCQNPDEYLFWDGTHPTKAVHAIVAMEAAKLIQ